MALPINISSKKVLKRVLLWSVVFVLSGCTTLGPEYKEPQVKWLERWQTDLYGQVTNNNPQQEIELNTWWRLFNDPALNQLIINTKAQNLNLRIAGLRILESRAQLGIAGSSLYPQLQQVSGSIIAAETVRRGGSLPNNDQSLVSYQAGYSLGWELDFWGKYQRSIESADAAFFNSIANQQNMQVLLISQVADLYFNYRTLEQRIEIAKNNAEIQKRSFDITEKLYQEGQDSELDLQQAKSQYLATLSTIPKLQILLTKSRNALATLLARPPGDIPELSLTPSQTLPLVDTINLKDIPANLILRRPDIRASAWLIAAQSAQIGIAEADFYPSISLLGSLSWSGDDISSTPDNGLLGIGPGIKWNIFDHGRIENNVRLQDARLQQAIENYQLSVLSAAREIDDAAISIIKTAEQISILLEAVKASERGLSLANTRYREGYSGFQRVLDAQRAVFSQTDQSLVNKGNHISAVISLYKALGGGWTETPIESVVPEETINTLKERTDWGDLLTSPQPSAMTTDSGAINNDR